MAIRKSDFLGKLQAGFGALVPRDMSILLACSGGADSVALVVGCHCLAQSTGLRATIAHFNHGWRPESKDDEAFVRMLAERLDIPFVAGSPSALAQKATVRRRTPEEGARIDRYRFLASAAAARGIGHVATAHTRDDQVETVLFAILRGTGLRGLSGMPDARNLEVEARPSAEPVRLVRPMLAISRTELEKFLGERGFSFRVDVTNAELRHTRNRIRHSLLPKLRAEFNPAVDVALLKLAKQSKQADRLIHRRSQRLLKQALAMPADATSFNLDLAVMRNARQLIAGRAILLQIEALGWPRGEITAAHIERVLEMVRRESPRRQELPSRIVIEIVKTCEEGGVLRFSRRT